MQDRIFSDREKAMEANYFRQEDDRLLAKLREGAKFDEIALAVRDKLHVDNPDLLERVRALGITADNASAFLLAPLVQVAWGGDSVTRGERETVLRLARERGVEDGSTDQEQLLTWLEVRPDDSLFETALEVIKHGLAVLPRFEQEERIKRIVEACHEVAKASGSKISWVLGLFEGINSSEASALDAISKALRRGSAASRP
jgi:hypothetical protein